MTSGCGHRLPRSYECGGEKAKCGRDGQTGAHLCLKCERDGQTGEHPFPKCERDRQTGAHPSSSPSGICQTRQFDAIAKGRCTGDPSQKKRLKRLHSIGVDPLIAVGPSVASCSSPSSCLVLLLLPLPFPPICHLWETNTA